MSENVSTPDLLKWLLGITRPVHGPLMLSLACRIIGLSLDIALFAVATGGVIHLVTTGDGMTSIIVVLVVLSLTKAAFYYLEQFTGHYVAFKALELLRTHVFAKLWPKAPAIVTESRSGDILASLTRDVDRIEVVYAHTFAPVVSAYIVGPAAVITAGVLYGWANVAGIAVCLAVSLLIVPFIGTRQALTTTRVTLAQRRDIAHHISDSVFGSEEVLGYGRADERIEAMDSLGDDISRSSRVPRDLTGFRRGANVTLTLLAVVSVVWLGSSGATPLTPVVVAALAAGAIRLFEGPRGVEDSVGYIDHSLAAARRLWEISHAPERVSDGPLTLNLDHAPAVRFENITYSYPLIASGSDVGDDPLESPSSAPDAHPALRNVTLDVPAGGHAVLVGHSGSGKSTLGQLLSRHDDPDSGTISIDGESVSAYTLDSLRHSVVAVSQRNQLLDTTLSENLRLGAPDATDDELWQALTVAGLDDEVRAMPEQLLTPVGRNGSALSGGQAQRLCLARALLMHPRVLVLDEFTANLNIELENRIRESLADWPEDLTIIEITHRLRAAAAADVIAVIDNGEVILSGSPDSIPSERLEDLLGLGPQQASVLA